MSAERVARSCNRCVCHFFNSKNREYFRIRKKCPAKVWSTKFLRRPIRAPLSAYIHTYAILPLILCIYATYANTLGGGGSILGGLRIGGVCVCTQLKYALLAVAYISAYCVWAYAADYSSRRLHPTIKNNCHIGHRKKSNRRPPNEHCGFIFNLQPAPRRHMFRRESTSQTSTRPHFNLILELHEDDSDFKTE